jgi:hypothetical protein
MEYQLSDLRSLQKLRSDKALKNSIRKIKVTSENILQSQIFEEKLNKYYFACGCQAGTITVFLVMLSYGLLWWSSGFSLSVNWWQIVATLFAAALAGKLTGLLISRYRLERTFRVLETLYTQSRNENS